MIFDIYMLTKQTELRCLDEASQNKNPTPLGLFPNNPVQGFLRQMEQFLTDMSNRVEHQNEPKRPQSGGRLGSFWCSTRPSADTGTD